MSCATASTGCGIDYREVPCRASGDQPADERSMMHVSM